MTVRDRFNALVQADLDDTTLRPLDRARRQLRLVERLGWLVVLVDFLVPDFTLQRALLTLPDFPRSFHIILIAYLLGLRLALLMRVPPAIVRVGIALGAALLIAAAFEWFAFKPLFQGRGTYVDQQIAKIIHVKGDEMDLLFEDGSIKHAQQGMRAYALSNGDCLTVEWFRGRLGVMWIDFYPRPPYPGNDPLSPDRCFFSHPPVLEHGTRG